MKATTVVALAPRSLANAFDRTVYKFDIYTNFQCLDDQMATTEIALVLNLKFENKSNFLSLTHRK